MEILGAKYELLHKLNAMKVNEVSSFLKMWPIKELETQDLEDIVKANLSHKSYYGHIQEILPKAKLSWRLYNITIDKILLLIENDAIRNWK